MEWDEILDYRLLRRDAALFGGDRRLGSSNFMEGTWILLN